MSQTKAEKIKESLVQTKSYKVILTEFKQKFLLGIKDDQQIDELFIMSQFDWLMDQLCEVKYLSLSMRLLVSAICKLKMTKGDLDSIQACKDIIELLSLLGENISEASEASAGNDEQLRSLYACHIKANLKLTIPLIKKVFAIPNKNSHDVVGEIDDIIKELTLIKNQHKDK